MRPPFYYPNGFFMNSMPMQMPMRYPMYAPYTMRGPMFSQMPMPRQIPFQAAGAGLAEAGLAGAGLAGAGLAGAEVAGLAGAAGAADIAGAAASSAPRLDSFLAGANSLFSNAQKFTPYVQQAAPMFKNLPALWKMYKGFKGEPDTSAELARDIFESTAIQPTEQRSTQRQATAPVTSRPSVSPTAQPSVPPTSRPSVPRIFQPPFDF